MTRSAREGRSRRLRRAYTLIEVLTTIGIIGLLIALLIPAVQMARETARRARCASHLQQIGVALNNYASSFGTFPGASIGQGYSPHSMILPYLEQRALYDALNFNIPAHEVASTSPNFTAIRTSLTVFLCPSDRSSSGNNPAVWSSYPANRGVYDRTGAFDNGAFWISSHTPLHANFADGMSTTAAVSEWVLGPSGILRRNPKGSVFDTPDLLIQPGEFDRFVHECHDLDPGIAKVDDSNKGMYWHQGGYMHTNYNHILGPNDHSCMTGGGHVQIGAFSASSHHSGGVNLLFADGHVRFVTESINIATWRAIATRNGGEVVGEGSF